MAKAVRRVVVWFVALYIAVQLIPTDAVLEALLQFSAAGVLPLVNVAMPPAATLLLLTEVGILMLLLIFRRELSALARRRRLAKSFAPVLSAATPAKPPVVITIPGTPGLLTRAARYIARHTPRQLRRLVAYYKPRLLLLAFRVLYYGEWVRTWLLAHSRALRGQLIEAGKWLWQIASPYLWQFDRYLETQCKRAVAALRQEATLLKTRLTSKD